MAIRVEREYGSQRIVVSIDARGVLRVHFVDREHGEVIDQWTESQLDRWKEKVGAVALLANQAREAERREKKEKVT
jgi:imidazole glycerol phosphate synthase subunit HisF